MEKGEKLTGGPYWTQNWIEAMWRFTAERFVDFDTGTVDFEALGREEYEFRKALFFRNFKNSPRARESFEAAANDYSKKVANGQKGGRPRKNQEFTADGELREDSQAKHDGSAITRNETRAHDALEPSANIYATRQAKNGDADTREGSEDCTCRESGAQSPTTVSNISQDAAHRKAADDCKAQTSCTIYDQETDRRISTDEALDLLRAGVMATSQAPVRNGSDRPPVRSHVRNSRRPTSREEFHAFVADCNLHEDLAEEWYAMHEARGWNDESGTPIKNWRGALKNYCVKTEQKRRTA